VWTGFIWLRIGTIGMALVNMVLGSVRGEEFLDYI
jgi:hypothetical protein